MLRRIILLAIATFVLAMFPRGAIAQNPDNVLFELHEPEPNQFVDISSGTLLSFSTFATNSDPQPWAVQLTVTLGDETNYSSEPFTLDPGISATIPVSVYVDDAILARCATGMVQVSLSFLVNGEEMGGNFWNIACSVAGTPPPTTPVTVPDNVSIYPVCGPNNDLYSIGATPVGLIFESESGWIEGTLTVSWSAAEGYHIEGPSSRTYTDEGLPCIPVTPVAPTQTQVCGPDNDLVQPADQPDGIDGMEFEAWSDGVYKIYYYPADGYEIPAGMDTITLHDTGECPGATTTPEPTAIPTVTATATATAIAGSGSGGHGGDATSGTGGSGGGGAGGSGSLVGNDGRGGDATSGTGGSGGAGGGGFWFGDGGAGGEGGSGIINNTIVGSGGGGGSFSGGGGGGIAIYNEQYIIFENVSLQEYCSDPLPGNIMINSTIILPSSNQDGDCHGGIYINENNQPITIVNTTINNNRNECNMLQGGGIYIYGDLNNTIHIGTNVTIWTASATQGTTSPYGTTVVGENNLIDLSDLPAGMYRLALEPDDAEAFDVFVRVVDPNAVTSLPNTGTGHAAGAGSTRLLIPGLAVLGLIALAMRLRNIDTAVELP